MLIKELGQKYYIWLNVSHNCEAAAYAGHTPLLPSWLNAVLVLIWFTTIMYASMLPSNCILGQAGETC